MWVGLVLVSISLFIFIFKLSVSYDTEGGSIRMVPVLDGAMMALFFQRCLQPLVCSCGALLNVLEWEIGYILRLGLLRRFSRIGQSIMPESLVSAAIKMIVKPTNCSTAKRCIPITCR
jgi:hypothetical protein